METCFLITIGIVFTMFCGVDMRSYSCFFPEITCGAECCTLNQHCDKRGTFSTCRDMCSYASCSSDQHCCLGAHCCESYETCTASGYCDGNKVISISDPGSKTVDTIDDNSLPSSSFDNTYDKIYDNNNDNNINDGESSSSGFSSGHYVVAGVGAGGGGFIIICCICVRRRLVRLTRTGTATVVTRRSVLVIACQRTGTGPAAGIGAPGSAGAAQAGQPGGAVIEPPAYAEVAGGGQPGGPEQPPPYSEYRAGSDKKNLLCEETE